jgi:hypothetical protein
MKKIIRLTESDLTRIVRRVIKEQQSGGYTQNAKTAIKLIEDGIAYIGIDGATLESSIARGVKAIKTKEDYEHVLKHANAKGFKTIMTWIGSDMSWQSETDNTQGVKDIVGNNKYLREFNRHLSQFNPNEKIAQ